MGSNSLALIFALAGLFPFQLLLGQQEEFEIKNEDLKALVASFDKEIAKLEAPLRALEDQYEAQFQKLGSQIGAEGDLDRTLLVQNEIDSFRNEPIAEIERDFPQLKTVRRIYLSQRRLRTRQLEASVTKAKTLHKSRLETYQTKLTQAGMLPEALEVRTYLASLNPPKEPEIIEIELFWLPDFRGDSVKLTVPIKVPRFAQHPQLRNDSLRSIKVPENVTVTVGSGPELSGEVLRIRKDTEDIRIKGISSLEAK